MGEGKRGRGGGVTRGGLFRRIASAQPPRPPLTMPDREPPADQPPTIGGRPPPPAPRAREPTAAPAPAVFRQVAQWWHGLLLHLPPKKAVTVALIAYYGNSSGICNKLLPSPKPAQRHRLTSWTADHGPGWGVVYRPGHRIGAESLNNSSPSSHVLTPVSFSPDIGGVV
jgi:hypothetical protein